ncbi:MAG TPA: aminoglycoside phosphotransferase family protein, partial [Trueperaceae bacterium]|nr:aminoglycoside phosphotransferase family protein [Trueperaceae bacterium]
MLDEYLARWRLQVDGDPIVTPRARLLPVRHDGLPAMLKVATYPAEVIGNAVLAWWDSAADDSASGAARVLLADGAAIVMERAVAPRSLVAYYDEGRFDEAIAIIVATAKSLHAPRATRPPPGLVPLERWFADLQAAAERGGDGLRASASAATNLLAEPGERTVLHGDLHHENILDFGDRGWRAIDPKAVEGDRYFDYVHHLFDPDDARVPSLDAIL